MTINVVELHHHAVRVPQAKADEVRRFYEEVLGLPSDAGRPHIPAVPGSWHFVGPKDGPTTQIHIMGADGTSGIAKAPDQDPTKFHVALAVDDVQKAREELDRMGTPYWVAGEAIGIIQLFLNDPAGNMIELHQVGTCNCNRVGMKGSRSMA